MIQKLKYNNQYSARKTTFLLVVLFGFIHSATAQKENDRTEEKLKGKIKSLTEISYEAIENNGKIEKGNRITYNFSKNDFQRKYNENGNVTERYEYKSDGSLLAKETYTYNENGIQIEGSEYRYYEDSLITQNIHLYANGKKMGGTIYLADGILESNYFYKYDEEGNRLEIAFYNADSLLDMKRTFVYDQKGNEIENKTFNSEGSLFSEFIQKYDEKGNRIEAIIYINTDNQLKISSKYEYSFDKLDNCIQLKHYNLEGILEEMFTYKYDEHGNNTEKNVFDSVGYLRLTFTTKFTYDKKGNWIKATKFMKEYSTQHAKFIIERTFEYYE